MALWVTPSLFVLECFEELGTVRFFVRVLRTERVRYVVDPPWVEHQRPTFNLLSVFCRGHLHRFARWRFVKPRPKPVTILGLAFHEVCHPSDDVTCRVRSPGITTPGTFRPWSFDSFDGLLLCGFAHLVSCGRHLRVQRAEHDSGVARSAGKPADRGPKAVVARRVRMCSTEVSRGCVACRWLGELDPGRRVSLECVTHLTCSEEPGGRRAQPPAGCERPGRMRTPPQRRAQPPALASAAARHPKASSLCPPTSCGDQTCVWSAEQNVLRHRMPDRRPGNLRSPIHHHVDAFGSLDTARERHRSNPAECCHPAAACVPPGSGLVHPPRRTTIRNPHRADR